MTTRKNPDLTIEDFREKNRLNQERFYNLNKEKINEARREKRKQEKLQKQPPAIKLTEKVETSFTSQQIRNYLTENKQLFINNKEEQIQEKTIDDYLSRLNAIAKIINGEHDFIKAITDTTTATKLIKEKQLSHSVLNKNMVVIINILRALHKATIIKTEKLNKLIEPYDNLYQISQLRRQIKENTDRDDITKALPLWSVYLQKIQDKFYKNSKEYLIATLYSENSIRNEYVDTFIYKQKFNPENPIDGFFIPPRGNITFYKSHHKTSAHTEPINYTFNTEATKIIRAYITKHKIQDREPLLKGSIHKIVVEMNRIAIDYDIPAENDGIRIFRHISASQPATPEVFIEQAKQSKHSAKTRLQTYQRHLKI